MNKTDFIRAAVEANLGAEADLKKKGVPELKALCVENIPGFKEKLEEAERAEERKDAAGGEDRGDDPRTGKKVKIIIEKTADPDGKLDVFGNVNGFTFNAKRGVEVEMDEGFVKHLESIKVEDYEQVLDDKGKATGETRIIERRRYNITRV